MVSLLGWTLTYSPLRSSAAYFVGLGLGHDEASELHLKYYTQYGLALRGLTRHHDIGSGHVTPIRDCNA